MSRAARVLATPRDANPYQDRLYGAMPTDRALVRYPDSPTPSQSLNLLLEPLSLAYYRLRGFRVLHVHWVFHFTLPWATRARPARLAMQWWFSLYLLVARLLGYRIVWTAHDLLPHTPVFLDDELVRDRLVGASDVVIALSPATATELRGLGARDVRVIPFGPYSGAELVRGTRAAARERMALADADILVVFFGRVDPYKGVDLLLGAAARLAPSPAVRVLVLGECRDASYHATVLDAARRAGESVTLDLRFVPDAELGAILSAADFAAFPFLEVTNSSSVYAALAFGLPVVIPDLANLRDVPAACAVRYEPGDDGLLRALERAVALTPRERSAMSNEAVAHANSTDWSTVAASVLAVYDELLARP